MDIIANFKPKEELHMKMAAKVAKLPVGVLPYGIDSYGNLCEGKKCLYVSDKRLYQNEIEEFWVALDLLYRKVFKGWEEQGYFLDKNSSWNFYYGITEEEVKELEQKAKKKKELLQEQIE